MIRSIIIASLSIPALIFAIFSGVGIVFLIAGLLNGTGYNNGWLGMVYAGLMYCYFAVLISSIPTLLFGIPVVFLAKKHNALNAAVILFGATILGALFLSLGMALYISPFNIDIFWLAMLAGAFGGLFNGYVFLSRLKPNKLFNLTGAENAPSS